MDFFSLSAKTDNKRSEGAEAKAVAEGEEEEEGRKERGGGGEV